MGQCLRLAYQIDACKQENQPYYARYGGFPVGNAEAHYGFAVGEKRNKREQDNHDAQNGERRAKETPEIGVVFHEGLMINLVFGINSFWVS